MGVVKENYVYEKYENFRAPSKIISRSADMFDLILRPDGGGSDACNIIYDVVIVDSCENHESWVGLRTCSTL